MRTFTFTVPLDWSGPSEEEGSVPISWLAADGSTTKLAPGAPMEGDQLPPVSFTVRADPTMLDEIKIERRLDEVNGDIEGTVDLDRAISRQYARQRAEFVTSLWPEGRPEARTTADRDAQERLIDLLYYSEENEVPRLVLQRMTSLRDRQRVAAEWPILALSPPEGWEDVATRPCRVGVVEAIARAYLRARQEFDTSSGK